MPGGEANGSGESVLLVCQGIFNGDYWLQLHKNELMSRV